MIEIIVHPILMSFFRRSLLSLLAFPVLAQQYTISTFAGAGPPDGAPATSIAIGLGSALALDSQGNLFFTAFGRNALFKIASGASAISKVVGSGVGFCSSTSATFAFASAAIADSNGNVYLADFNCNFVAKVSGGTVTLIAGNGGTGASGDGGPAINASVGRPAGLALDSSGNLFISQNGSHVIRMVSPAGIISTFAGTGSPGYSGDGGSPTAAKLNSPAGLAIDTTGALFIADSANNVIRRIFNNVITTVAGTGVAGYSGDGGPPTAAQLSYPSGVAVDQQGRFLIADSSNNVIRRVAAGTISTIAGTGNPGFSGDGGQATSAQLNYPVTLAMNSTGSLIYVVDQSNRRIRRISGGVMSTAAGNGLLSYSGDGGAASDAQLDNPGGIALNSQGDLLFADYNNSRVHTISSGIISSIPASPSQVAVDSSGVVYFTDINFHTVRKLVGSNAVIIAGTGSPGFSGDGGPATSAALNQPSGLAFDSTGALYILDLGNSRIRKVSGGTITTVAGNGTPGFSGDNGPAIAASIDPVGIGLDSSLNLYIAERNNGRLRKVSGSTISTIAGTGVAGHSGDGGPALNAQISPIAVAADLSGNLYLGEPLYIRRISAGQITTIAGNGSTVFSGDGGPATSASLGFPNSLALDSAGNVYFSDSDNNRIRLLTAPIVPVAITFASVPQGLNLTVDGVTITTPNTVSWNSNTSHTIAAPSPQPGPSLRYRFNTWSDGGNQSHTVIAPFSPATFTAAFTPQYLLTLNANPANSGTPTPNIPSPDGSGYYDANTSLQITATPATGYIFSSFSGDLTGSANPQPLTMSAARTVTANFICAYSLSASSASFPATASNGSVNLTAGSSCFWTVTGIPAWLTIASSGTGSTNISFSLAANPGQSSRTANLNIGGQAFAITQQGTSCSYSLSAGSANFPATASNGSVDLTTGSTCAWTVTGAPAWLTITSGGTGSSTISFSLAANPGQSPRTANLTIGGQAFTITQQGTSCAYSLSAGSANFPATASNGSVDLTTGSTCAWTVTGAPAWLTITSGGTGSSTISFSLAANPGQSARTANLTIGGQAFTITQQGTSCAYSLSANSATFPATASSGSVNLTTGSTCSWTVTGVPAWLTITSGGTGSTNLSFSLAANTTLASRTANLTIGGQPFTITQQGTTPTCSYALSAPGASFPTSSSSTTVNVTAPSGCAWSVTGTVPSWIVIESGNPGSGNGALVLTAAANPSGHARSATLTIAGLPFTITQAGLGCSIGLNPTQASLPSSSGTSSFSVTATAPDCPRPASATVSWIHITSGASATGSGQIAYSFDANPSPNTRTGAITVGTLTFAITQAGAAPCTFSLPVTTQSFTSAGGTATATVSTQAGCPWTPTANATFLSTSGTGSGSGNFTFSIAPNPNPDPRTGTISIGNATLTIQQAGTGAAIACQFLPATPQTIRAEGRTELLKDLLLRCTGSAPTGGLTGDITLRLNTPVTSRKLDATADATEATLLLNDPATPQIGVNAFSSTLAGLSTLRWNAMPLLPAGTNVTQTFRLTNVRIDASFLGAGDTPIPITASATIQSPVPVPLASSTQTIATSSLGLAFQAAQPVPGASSSQILVPLIFQERFPNAFKLRSGPNSESGTVNTSQLGPRTGLADTATRLRVRITGIPVGGQVRAPLTSLDGKAILVSADANGTGGAPVSGSPQLLTVTNGTATATWEITATDTTALETISFNLIFDNTATTGVQVTGNFAPVSTAGVATAADAIPRFRDFSIPQTLVNLRTNARLTSPSQRPATPSTGGIPVVSGSNVSFAGTIINNSQTSAPNVAIDGVIPTGLDVQSCTTSSGNPCHPTPDGGIRVNLPALDPGSSETVSIAAVVRPDFISGGIMEITFTATSDLPNAELDASTSAFSFYVSKNCTFGLSLNALSVASTGDLARLDITTAPGCFWNSSVPSWITLSPASGAGSAHTTVNIAPNTGASARTATLTAGGQTVSVWQAPSGCTATLTADNPVQGPSGGILNVSIADNPVGCASSVSVSAPWLQPQGAALTTFTVLPNYGYYPRTAVIRAAGATLQILQKQTNSPPPVSVFTDVPLDHPYADHIRLLRRAAITVGCTTSTYCPDNNVTRGQMAVFIIRSIFGGDIFSYPQTPFFTDVPTTHIYFSYIQKMKELGITSGCSPTTYCPDDFVTRGQMAVFLIRGRLGIPANAPFPYPLATFFSDVPTNHVYFSFIQKMKELAITSGCSATTYCPDSFTTRGQMAVFLIRTFFTP